MKCPVCGGKTRVIDSEYPYQGDSALKKRRHVCLNCGRRFNSYQGYEQDNTASKPDQFPG